MNWIDLWFLVGSIDPPVDGSRPWNPARDHQLRLVVFPTSFRVSAPSQVVFQISAINSMNQVMVLKIEIEIVCLKSASYGRCFLLCYFLRLMTHCRKNLGVLQLSFLCCPVFVADDEFSWKSGSSPWPVHTTLSDSRWEMWTMKIALLVMCYFYLLKFVGCTVADYSHSYTV